VLDKGWYESAIGNSGRKGVVAVVVQWEADERVEVSVVVPRRRGMAVHAGLRWWRWWYREEEDGRK
jgi:hypothetical protein